MGERKRIGGFAWDSPAPYPPGVPGQLVSWSFPLGFGGYRAYLVAQSVVDRSDRQAGLPALPQATDIPEPHCGLHWRLWPLRGPGQTGEKSVSHAKREGVAPVIFAAP